MPPTDKALLRYQAISAYLALDLPRGQRGKMLETLANKTWHLPDGRPVRFSAETLRAWVRRYRNGGLAALEDKPRPRRGVQALDDNQIALLCELKRDVPERSLDRILEMVDTMALLPPGVLTRSTLHRVLQAHGLSGRPKATRSTTDLDRFEALAPNDLWQSDMLAGPWLPDPQRPGKRRRAWLYAFLDDHSRQLLAGRFSFKGDLPALELVFREALRRHGVPVRAYYDNGAVYRSKHMKQVCATLGIHGVVFTTPYRPEGHGKIEAFNRLCTAAFIAEVKASAIETLDQLNLAFRAWVDHYYNRRVHSETQQTPRDRWRAGLSRIRHVDETSLRNAFLWSETRKADKTGLLSLHGVRYQASAELARKKVEVRFDPERMDEVELWLDGTFRERAHPFEVQPHRRAHVATVEPTLEADRAPTVDWLGHLVAAHDADHFDPDLELQRALAERQAADDAVFGLLRDRLADEVFDESTVRDFLDRFGPFDPSAFTEAVDLAIDLGGADQHVGVLLHEVRTALDGGLR